MWVVERSQEPWLPLSIAFFACIFVLPFILLLPQKVKMIPPYLATVALIILFGFWIERYIGVVPSIWEGSVPLGLTELLVTLGFFGLFGLCYAAYATTFPLVPLRDDSLIVGKART